MGSICSTAVDKLAFTDILGEAAWSVTYITAHCRHLVVYSGLRIRNSLAGFSWKKLFRMH